MCDVKRKEWYSTTDWGDCNNPAAFAACCYNPPARRRTPAHPNTPPSMPSVRRVPRLLLVSALLAALHLSALLNDVLLKSSMDVHVCQAPVLCYPKWKKTNKTEVVCVFLF